MVTKQSTAYAATDARAWFDMIHYALQPRMPMGGVPLRAASMRFARTYATGARCAPHAASGPRGGGPDPKAKSKLLYREIFPPMIRVLAYSTCAYFGMHLAWVLLKSDEEKRVQTAELGDMRAEIRALQGKGRV